MVSDWARRNDIAYTGFTNLAEKPQVVRLIKDEIDRTNAELAAAILKQAGFDARLLTAVPSPPGLTKDRTYGSAVALRNWLRNAYPELKQLDVLTLGTHSRRTRLLFQKALGDSIRVGIIAVQDRDFDPDRWWMSSSGFRTVLDEGIAYFYARFLFHPDT